MDSGASLNQQRGRVSAEGHPIMFSGGSIMDSASEPRDHFTSSGTAMYETAQDLDQQPALDASPEARNTGSPEAATSSYTVLDSNAGQNESAGLQNLRRYLQDLRGETVHYRPITLSDSSLTSGSQAIPGMEPILLPFALRHLSG